MNIPSGWRTFFHLEANIEKDAPEHLSTNTRHVESGGRRFGIAKLVSSYFVLA